MKRTIQAISSLLLLVAALLAPGGSATGAPPTPVSTSETFGAGEACPFPIKVEFTGGSGFIELPGNPQFTGIATSPGLRVTVTNTDSGERVTLNATGAFRFVAIPGSDDIKIVAGGHNFLYGEPQIGVTALLTTGPIELVARDNRIIRADLSGARVRDVCAELA